MLTVEELIIFSWVGIFCDQRSTLDAVIGRNFLHSQGVFCQMRRLSKQFPASWLDQPWVFSLCMWTFALAWAISLTLHGDFRVKHTQPKNAHEEYTPAGKICPLLSFGIATVVPDIFVAGHPLASRAIRLEHRLLHLQMFKWGPSTSNDSVKVSSMFQTIGVGYSGATFF